MAAQVEDQDPMGVHGMATVHLHIPSLNTDHVFGQGVLLKEDGISQKNSFL